MLLADAHSRTDQLTDRYFGKYRGFVKDNQDPLGMGRLQALVPDVLHDVPSTWALPCAPYAGPNAGQFTVPPVDAGVWIEFEAGDPSHPIWSGAWWGPGEVPLDQEAVPVKPEIKILRSDNGLLVALNDSAQTITVSDSNGANRLTINVQGGNIRVQSTSQVVVEAPSILLGENAVQHAVLGDLLLNYLNNLVLLFNSHVHVGETVAGMIPVTPAPPVPSFPSATSVLVSGKVFVDK